MSKGSRRSSNVFCANVIKGGGKRARPPLRVALSPDFRMDMPDGPRTRSVEVVTIRGGKKSTRHVTT